MHCSQVLIAQLNIRMRLQEEKKEVSVVAEKMAYGGVTRFEDLKRLPIGISVNFTSFSAKMLAFLAYYPKLLVPFFALGEEADITVRSHRSDVCFCAVCCKPKRHERGGALPARTHMRELLSLISRWFETSDANRIPMLRTRWNVPTETKYSSTRG